MDPSTTFPELPVVAYLAPHEAGALTLALILGVVSLPTVHQSLYLALLSFMALFAWVLSAVRHKACMPQAAIGGGTQCVFVPRSFSDERADMIEPYARSTAYTYTDMSEGEDEEAEETTSHTPASGVTPAASSEDDEAHTSHAPTTPTSALPPRARGVSENSSQVLEALSGWSPRRYTERFHTFQLRDSDGRLLAPNSPKPIPFENEYFEGRMVCILRTDPPDETYGGYFEGKQRLCEFQIQGRFKKAPNGILFMGAEVPRRLRLGMVLTTTVKIIMSFVKTRIMNVHWSLGSKKEPADPSHCELGHLVIPLYRAMDRVFISREDEPIPEMGLEFPESDPDRDQRRSGRSPDHTFEIGPTYSFSFHNPFTDFTDWSIKGMPTGPVTLRQFIGDMPIKIVTYDLDPERVAEGDLHRQCDKRYFLEWSMSYDFSMAEFVKTLPAPAEAAPATTTVGTTPTDVAGTATSPSSMVQPAVQQGTDEAQVLLPTSSVEDEGQEDEVAVALEEEAQDDDDQGVGDDEDEEDDDEDEDEDGSDSEESTSGEDFARGMEAYQRSRHESGANGTGTGAGTGSSTTMTAATNAMGATEGPLTSASTPLPTQPQPQSLRRPIQGVRESQDSGGLGRDSSDSYDLFAPASPASPNLYSGDVAKVCAIAGVANPQAARERLERSSPDGDDTYLSLDEGRGYAVLRGSAIPEQVRLIKVLPVIEDGKLLSEAEEHLCVIRGNDAVVVQSVHTGKFLSVAHKTYLVWTDVAEIALNKFVGSNAASHRRHQTREFRVVGVTQGEPVVKGAPFRLRPTKSTSLEICAAPKASPKYGGSLLRLSSHPVAPLHGAHGGPGASSSSAAAGSGVPSGKASSTGNLMLHFVALKDDANYVSEDARNSNSRIVVNVPAWVKTLNRGERVAQSAFVVRITRYHERAEAAATDAEASDAKNGSTTAATTTTSSSATRPGTGATAQARSVSVDSGSGAAMNGSSLRDDGGSPPATPTLLAPSTSAPSSKGRDVVWEEGDEEPLEEYITLRTGNELSDIVKRVQKLLKDAGDRADAGILQPLPHLNKADQSVRIIARHLRHATTAPRDDSVPPAIREARTKAYDLLCKVLTSRRGYLDRHFLHGGPADLGIAPNSKAGTPLQQVIVLRALWDGHWREECLVVHTTHLACYPPLSRHPYWVLALPDIKACRSGLSANSVPPFPSLHYLVIETVGRSHYFCFGSREQRDIVSIELGSLTATQSGDPYAVRSLVGGMLVADPKEVYIMNSGQWRPGKRLILNARRLGFDALSLEMVTSYNKSNHSPVRVEYSPLWRYSATLLQMVMTLTPETSDSLTQFLDMVASFKTIRVSTLPFDDPGTVCFWVNLYHVMLQHALLLLGPPSTQDWATFHSLVSYEFADNVFSLSEIEHCVLRGRMTRPRAMPKQYPPLPADKDQRHSYAVLPDCRINFVLNNASISGPPDVWLLTPDTLNHTLTEATSLFLERTTSVDLAQRIVNLHRLFDMYPADFAQPEGSHHVSVSGISSVNVSGASSLGSNGGGSGSSKAGSGALDCVRFCLRYVGKDHWKRLSLILSDAPGARPPTVKYSTIKCASHDSLRLAQPFAPPVSASASSSASATTTNSVGGQDEPTVSTTANSSNKPVTRDADVAANNRDDGNGTPLPVDGENEHGGTSA